MSLLLWARFLLLIALVGVVAGHVWTELSAQD